MSLVAHGIVSGTRMKAHMKGLAHELAEYHNKDTGLCCPSLDKLAYQLCCTVRNVQRGIEQLENEGIIRREARFSDGRQTTNNFIFVATDPSRGGDPHFTPEDEARFTPEGEAHFTQNQKKEPEEVISVLATKKSVARFTPPTAPEVQIESVKLGYGWTLREAERFVDFYSSKGWVVGKAPMKDWKAAVRNWQRSRKGSSESQPFEVYL